LADPLAALREDVSIPPEVLANADALLRLAPTDEPAARGVFPTVRLFWAKPRGFVEVEVFEDHIEIWPAGGQPVDLWYEPFTPDSALSEKLAGELR